MGYRVGIVSAIDDKKGLCRVNFKDADDCQSYWLAVLHHKTSADKCYWMPQVGEHVACMLDDNEEEGCILGAIYSDKDSIPDYARKLSKPSMAACMEFADGSYAAYNKQDRLMECKSSGAATIKAIDALVETSRKINAKSSEIVIEGSAKITASAPSVEINSPNTISLTAGSQVIIKAPLIRLIGKVIDR